MNVAKETTISIPRWAWGIMCALATTMLAGGMAWCTSVSGDLNQLKREAIDRAAVVDLLEKQGPYARDKANIEARLLTAEKALERHETDGRRFADSMARVEAKLDLLIPKKAQP